MTLSRLYLSILLLFVGFGAGAQINFDSSASFVYLKGKDGASLPANWMTGNYNPVGWLSGKMPFKYGSGTEGTLLNDMRNSYSTVYMRSTFNVSKLESLGDVYFSVNYADGFIIWINGEIAIQQNQPDSATYNSLSSGLHGSGTFVAFPPLPARDLDLKEGENVIAIQGFNSSLASSHFYFDMKMNAEVRPLMTGDSIKVVFSQPDGFYNQPFDLTLSVPDDSYDLVYSIDGSNPQKSATRINGGKNAIVRIDPTVTTGRPATPCFIVRASLQKGDLDPSFPLTQTYIFLDQVINQTNPGGGWPTDATINGQKIDLAMDPDVTTDPLYSGQIKGSLKSIPSISVVTDMEDLFNSATGIYVNATNHGDGWERFSSVELIDPNGKPGFAINAGLRIRGGYSRNDGFAKHAFRLFFRQEYDAPKLKFPLFDDEGTDEFDKVDLRCEQNYSWAHPGDNKDRNSFVREVFSRDTQRDLGQPYTRSRYYHLYLNGMYWGLYMTQERAEANFASDYFGGSKEDYDVIKVNVNGNYSIEATDGNTDSWKKIYDLCTKGFADNANYFALEGKDENGIPKKGGEVMVNIDNLIDYMQVIFYTGNFDAPVSAFIGSNSGPNNFYAIDRRDDRSSGFQFFAHDSEHSLMFTKEGPGIGIEENRVEIPNMQVNSYTRFQPQWLHYKLTFNKEYRQRFADHVYKNFYNNGVFTPEANHDRMQKRVAQVAPAVVSESARWGDTQRTIPYTYSDWETEINNVYTQYFPVRTDIVITQLKTAGLYSSLNPPIITKDESRLNPGIYAASDNYHITLWSSTGQIYYTLDGSDPRLLDDKINPSAIAIKSGEILNFKGTAVVNARIVNGGRWSALETVKFLNTNEDYSNLKITELNYHPTDSLVANEIVSGKSFEFVELKNIGDKPINLTGLKFTSSIDYQFRDNEVLDPKQFYVIASKPKWFYERHFMVPTGNFSSNFSNSGEQVTISDSKGSPVIDFLYLDINPWATEPDGGGSSLTAAVKYPNGSPADPAYWMSSSVYDGTPFADDPGVIDSVDKPALNNSGIAVYPNPTKGILRIKVDDVFSDVQVEIFNISGSLVYKSKVGSENALNLGRLNIYPGIYLVNVKNNQKTSVHKIIYQP